MLVLEALKARHGDCLILHYGPEDNPRRILIDGGAARVYDEFLKPRLEQLRGDQESFRFHMLLISHIDDDHLNGVLDMAKELRQASANQMPIRYRFSNLWHNSFDDVLGNEQKGDALLATTSEQLEGLAGLDSQSLPPTLPVQHDSALVLSSVAQGRTLRLDAKALGLRLNRAGGRVGGLVMAGVDEPMGHGMVFKVVGPNQKRIDSLQRAWDKHLVEKNLGKVEVAAFVDGSVANLASLVVLAEMNGKRLLLTGDARGDDLLKGLEARGLLDNGPLHVDVLKLPHHGSEHNVAPVFFARIRADHYLVSGDGRYGNPEALTFKMLLDSRQPGDGRFTIHMTYGSHEMLPGYPARQLEKVFTEARARGLEFDIATPGDELSLSIDLS